MSFTDREKLIMLATSRGVFEAMARDEHLADAAARYGITARTRDGDAFETAFLWARDERYSYERAQLT